MERKGENKERYALRVRELQGGKKKDRSGVKAKGEIKRSGKNSLKIKVYQYITH